MPAIYFYHHTVHDDEIDGQGHVNNLCYLHWMQDAAIEHSSAQGWTPQRYREEGAGWVVRTHAIEYLQPAFAGDAIVVKTWVANFKKIQSLRKYRIERATDGALLATAETNWAFIGLEHRVPRRIPAALIDSFEIVADDDEV
jgi:acyl-CoA thioester hydrolase